jgi:aspartate-semialdehyde dehydrogenase
MTPITRNEAGTGVFRVAVVGAASLKGKEVSDVLTDRNFPSVDVRLLDDEEALGQLEAVGDEATFIQKMLPEHLEKVDFTFLAADAEFSRKNWKTAKAAGSEIIDLSYALEDEPGARLRAPWIEKELGTNPAYDITNAPVVIVHPAATVLGLLLLRAGKAAQIRTSVVTVLEPASEQGKRGMDELHQQTVNLLSFQQLPTAIYDAQIAFNAVARYGEQSKLSLDKMTQRIARHLRTVTDDELTVPSLMLLQMPIFHGHGFSLYIEFESPVSVSDLERHLEGEHITVTHTAEDTPTNVNAAGQDGIQISVRPDAQNKNAVWIWAVADNLRVAALSAVECAERMAAARPRGQVQ